jgi:serine/threonine protein kinase
MTTAHGPGLMLLGGRYELLAVLGGGGMAQVYRARDHVLDRDVAVKMLRETTTDASERARFVSEARILGGLSHSGLVTVLDAGLGAETQTGIPGEEISQPFVVMELVEGPALSRVIGQGPMPLDEVASIGIQVAQALAYVHAHGVIHRDVKPGNVLLGPDSCVKLADFGIARLLDDVATRYTAAGQAIGTAAYLAPEQVAGGEVTGAADIYSLGLVLLEAITGQREYLGTPTEAAVARLHRSPRVPRELPASWRDLLSRMTSRDPRVRPTGYEVAEHLRDGGVAPLSRHHETARFRTSLLVRVNATRVLTARTAVASPPVGDADTAPWTPPHERINTLVGHARYVGRRLRALDATHRTAVEAAVAAVVVVPVMVGAIVAGTGHTSPSPVPGNTPSQLREPLQQLHDAVDGTGR